MTFPDDIPTRTVTLPGSTSVEDGSFLEQSLLITASRPLIWAATGWRFLPTGVIRRSFGGELTLELPRTDVAGWRDADTGALIDVTAPGSFTHTYTATVLRDPGERTELGEFVLPAGAGPVDLGSLLPVGTEEGRQVSVPDSWTPALAAVQQELATRLSEESLAGTYVALAGDEQVVDAKTTFTSQEGLRSSTWFGLGAGVGSARMPHYENLLLNGPSFSNTLASGGGDDYVGSQLNVTFNGGFAGLKVNLVGNMTSGSPTLTLTSGTFNLPVKVGYTLVIPGAGAGGGTLKTKIAAITDSTHATLEASAGTTVTGAAIIGSLAADHNFLFAANDFFRTGSVAGDLDGIDYVFGRLIEMHMYTPNATLNTVFAASIEAGVESSGAGSTIASLIGMRVKGPTNHGGATIASVHSLYVAAPTATGTSETYAIKQDGGGKNIFTGQISVGRDLAAGGIPLLVHQPLGATAAAIEVRDYTLGTRRFYIGSTGAANSQSAVTAYEGLGSQVVIGAMTGNFPGIRMGASGSNDEIRRTSAGVVESTARFAWVTANVQTTVGATGSAAALPANPYSYLKVKHPDGTDLVIPAYRAA